MVAGHRFQSCAHWILSHPHLDQAGLDRVRRGVARWRTRKQFCDADLYEIIGYSSFIFCRTVDRSLELDDSEHDRPDDFHQWQYGVGEIESGYDWFHRPLPAYPDYAAVGSRPERKPRDPAAKT